jgi:hypothetical protein
MGLAPAAGDPGAGSVRAGEGLSALTSLARRLGRLLRAEDWLLAGWVGIVTPFLSGAQGANGPFDPGRPIEGLLRSLAVLAALVGLGVRTADGQGTASGSTQVSAEIGPLAGGMFLVGASGIAGLGLDPSVVLPVLLVVLVGVAIARWRLAPIPVTYRRALLTPYVMAAGGLFWEFMDQILGPGGAGPFRLSALFDAPSVAIVLGFLVAFSSIYYAMLILAPRMVAEREGGPIHWLVRYGLFLASVLFGFGWLGILGT